MVPVPSSFAGFYKFLADIQGSSSYLIFRVLISSCYTGFLFQDDILCGSVCFISGFGMLLDIFGSENILWISCISISFFSVCSVYPIMRYVYPGLDTLYHVYVVCILL